MKQIDDCDGESWSDLFPLARFQFFKRYENEKWELRTENRAATAIDFLARALCCEHIVKTSNLE
jgi:hypothetical protein